MVYLQYCKGKIVNKKIKKIRKEHLLKITVDPRNLLKTENDILKSIK